MSKLDNFVFSLGLVVFISFIVTIARAQECKFSDQEKIACTNDAFKLCQPVLLNGIPVVFDCLKKNRSSLSSDCKRVIDRCK